MPSTTEFKEFNLKVASRDSLKVTTTLSTETKELEECKKQFKARPLNKNIFTEPPKVLEK